MYDWAVQKSTSPNNQRCTLKVEMATVRRTSRVDLVFMIIDAISSSMLQAAEAGD